MTPVLELRQVRRSYGEGRGIHGVDLAVEPGEIYGLLGPNGAGKTSLVRAITGRLRLDGGSVILDGGRRALGLVPQEVALYPDLTTAENLELLGELAGLSRHDARRALPDALAWTGLADRAHSLVSTLSGGQQRRVNLAAGTMHGPRLLVLDEPTVGVDLPARERIHEMLRDLRRRGVAILLATHDLDQAAELCDRIGILVDGQLRVEGTVSALIARWFPAGARELVLTLGAPADAAGLAALAAARITGGAHALTWSGAIAGGLAQLADLVERLERAGLSIVDARVREPGLRGVFLSAVGRAFTE